jgi:hypothetical protein
VLVGLWRDAEVHLAADAGPSLVMLAACIVLVGRWLRVLHPIESGWIRATVWD